MAHTITWYREGLKALLNKEIDLDTDTIKVALMDSSWALDQNDQDMADVNTMELNEGGGDTNGYYAGFSGTGRQTLAAAALTEIADGMKFDANDVVFSTLGAALDDTHAAVVYHHNTSDADSKVLLVVEFNPVFDPDGNDLTIQWHTNGISTVKPATGKLVFYKGIIALLNKEIDLDTDTIKVALMDSDWVADLTDEDMADVNAMELNAGGGDTNGYYAGFAGTGRQTLANAALSLITGGTKFDADDTTFTTLGAALDDVWALVIYHHNTSDADSKLLIAVELDPVYDPDGNDLPIQWHPDGIATLKDV